MFFTRLQACLFCLAAATCQSAEPAPQAVAISPRLAANPTAEVTPTAPESPRGAPAGVRGTTPAAPRSTADGHFSEALVPEGAHLDSTRAKFVKRGRDYEAKVGSGKHAFTWVVNTAPTGYLDLITIKDGSSRIEPLHGAGLAGAGKQPKVVNVERVGDDLVIRYADGVTQTLAAIGRSLRIETVRDPGPRRGRAVVDLGGVLGTKGVDSTAVFRVPYFDIASVATLGLKRGGQRYLTAWFDTDYSHASTLLAQYPGEEGTDGELRFSEIAHYLDADNGRRRPVKERVWISWSPELTDVLPSMDRAVLEDRESFGELYYISMNCTPFSEATANVEALRGLGVKDLHIWMKQWQKDGFDEGYPNDVMPPRRQWGGFDGLRAMRDAADAAGYGFALHHNWLFNTVRLPGKSMLSGLGRPITVPDGGEYLKSSAALELVDEVEGELHEAFGTRGTYTDSLAAVIPQVDLDSSVEGWGLLGTTLADYTELLGRLRAIHGTPVTSEGSLGGGNVTWAGLVDVMPGSLFINSQPQALDRCGRYVEVVPHFALGRLHEISVRAGIGPPTRFVMPRRPTMTRNFTSEQRDLTQTLTALYGNAGYHWWYALTRPGSCAREWWSGMGLFRELSAPGREVASIDYVDDRQRELSLSEWLAAGHGLAVGEVRLHVTWKDGDELWANVTESSWQPKGRAESIAPYGHLAHAGDVTSAVLDTEQGVLQRLETPTRRFLDGRGKLVTALGITTDGAVGLERMDAAEGGGWQVYPIPEYTLEIPSEGREARVEWSRIGLAADLIGPGPVELVWFDERGAVGQSEIVVGPGLELIPGDFEARGAMSVRVTPAD